MINKGYEKKDESWEKWDRPHFSQVHWKYQYFAFVGFQNWRLALQHLHHIILISAVDTISILISNVCVSCVHYKFLSIYQYWLIYSAQLEAGSSCPGGLNSPSHCQEWPLVPSPRPIRHRSNSNQVCPTEIIKWQNNSRQGQATQKIGWTLLSAT